MKKLLLALALLSACKAATDWQGLAPAQPTDGPKVVFDLSRRPLPEIPFPNDLATRPDPGSPTGLRVNASIVAPSQLERNTRGFLDQLDGFGTYAPITVAFDADLDVLDLYNRQNNADPADDAVYLIDLTNGRTKPLDFNGGHFPYELANPDQYFANDPLAGVTNLLFPTTGPTPNFLHAADPSWPAAHGAVAQQSDDLLTFYERETHTLVMRPVLPLEQERRYAVVLTSRLHDARGRPIGSPHTGINHAAQTDELRPLPGLLPAGVALGDVSYAWAFTTQTTTRDLENIRHGLYGVGRYGLLGLQYPVRVVTGVTTTQTNYQAVMQVLQIRGTFTPGTPSTSTADYILPVAELTPLLTDPQVSSLLLGDNQQNVDALLATYKYIDYFVMGQFTTPSFLAGPGTPQDQTFQLDPIRATAQASPETVTFMLAVPKARPEVGHVAPFPVVVAGHGYKSTRIEHILGFAGTFAKFGLATISIDAFGHGLAVSALQEKFGRDKAKQYHLEAFADAVFQGRARDLDNDGEKDSGGDFWTADTFHTRDVVRQSIVDWMQLVRLLRSFDAHGRMVLGSTLALTGDFNRDGVPDVGGPVLWPNDVLGPDGKTVLFPQGSTNPGSDTFVFGISLGGILSAILPAVEPAIIAAAPTSGAGGLSDVGLRSTLDQVVQAVFLELFGPMFATCNYSPSSGPVDPQTFLPFGACNPGAPDGRPTLVMVVQDVNRERDVPVMPLSLAPGDRVVVKNLAQLAPGADCSTGAKVDGCSTALADSQGRLRLPIAADWPSLSATVTPSQDPSVAPRVKVLVLQPGDSLEVDLYPAAGGTPQIIKTFGADSSFYGVAYRRGDPLVAVARGFGLSRNTPELRRMLGLSQLALEPGDPVNYAPHYFKDPLPDVDPAEGGTARHPANVLVVGTSGDPAVPINTGIALARAAGLVELTAPDPDYGIPIDQVLIRSGAVEGVAKLRRFADPSSGPRAALGSHVRCDPGADCSSPVLIDPTGYSCDPLHGTGCTDGLAAPRLDPPLRQQLVRQSNPAPLPACGPLSPAVRGPGCYSKGASSCDPGQAGVSALLIPYLNREGQHGFRNPSPGKPFDMDSYLANLIGRFFECRGRELHFEACQTQLSSASPGGCGWIPPPPP